MHTRDSAPWRKPVNIMRISFPALLFTCGALLAGCATFDGAHSDSPTFNVTNYGRPDTYPVSTMGKVFIDFHDGGALMRSRVEAALQAGGLDIVQTKEESDTTIRIGARYGVERRGFLPLTGPAGQYFAETKPVFVEEGGGYVGAEQNQFVMGALTGHFFLADLFAAVSQQTGASAWFNKKLTGHPDGLCLGRGCSVVKTSVYVTLAIVTGGRTESGWRSLVNGAGGEPLVIEATGMALDGVLEPILQGLVANQQLSSIGDAR